MLTVVPIVITVGVIVLVVGLIAIVCYTRFSLQSLSTVSN